VYVNYRAIGYNPKLVAEKDAQSSGRICWTRNEKERWRLKKRTTFVRRAGEVLGQRENAKIHESSGEARYTMAQGHT